MSHRLYDSPRERMRVLKQRQRERARQRAKEAKRLEPEAVDPFHSHTWHDLDGEAYCRVCMTHWDTDLAEQQCSGGGLSIAECMRLSDTTPRRPHLTLDEVAWAHEQREAGVIWQSIADELERHVGVVTRAVADYRAYTGRIGRARAVREGRSDHG